ncbi:hypothetical protein BC629DRAFT_221771 [Irpex lacteus]|nr:hypothetical protein BC629DRAFT_221771 [Irpex lacteus]
MTRTSRMPVIPDSDESDDDSRQATHPDQQTRTREPPRKRGSRKEVDAANILDSARPRTRTAKQQLLANGSHEKLQKKLEKTEKELQKMKRQARREGPSGQPSGNLSSSRPVDIDDEFEEEEETLPMYAASAFTSKGIVGEDTPPQKKLKRLYNAPRDDRIDEPLPQSDDDSESFDHARTKRRSQSRTESQVDDMSDRRHGMSTGSRTDEQMSPARSLSPGPLPMLTDVYTIRTSGLEHTRT